MKYYEGESREEAQKILMEGEITLHIVPPGERHFGSTDGSNNKLKAYHNLHKMTLFLTILFLINE